MRAHPNDMIMIVPALVVIIALIAGVTWFQASMEARSYRKFCDTEVTWWDAVWLDLRIDECR